jgi:hypothetical protein
MPLRRTPVETPREPSVAAATEALETSSQAVEATPIELSVDEDANSEPRSADESSVPPGDEEQQTQSEVAPPLPSEQPPPLPDEAPPGPTAQDDGWAPVWDANANAFYFYNRFTQASQWENPRVPEPSTATYTATDHDRIAQPQYAPGTEPATTPKLPVAGGYNPAIHGDYDPNADYAVLAQEAEEQAHNPYLAPPPGLAGEEPAEAYAQQAAFNRFTGRFSNTAIHPTHTSEQHTDEAKSKRQLNSFFDVDAAANSHGGRSLRAERQERKLSKKELKEFQERRRMKKEEKRRAWLKD